MSKRIGTLYLNKQDSEDFVRAYLCPTHEEIEENRKRLEDMKDFVITDTIDGFKTEIEDIDISFMDEEEEKELAITIKVEVKVRDNKFYTDKNDKVNIEIKENKEFNLSYTKEILNIAA